MATVIRNQWLPACLVARLNDSDNARGTKGPQACFAIYDDTNQINMMLVKYKLPSRFHYCHASGAVARQHHPSDQLDYGPTLFNEILVNGARFWNESLCARAVLASSSQTADFTLFPDTLHDVSIECSV